MGVFCDRGIGLAAKSLWLNIAAGLAAARRGDHDTAEQVLRTVDQIHHYAATRSLAAVAANGGQRIRLRLSHQQVPNQAGERETSHHA